MGLDSQNKIYERHLEIARRDAREKAAAKAKPGEPVSYSLDVIKHVTGAHDCKRPTVALLYLQGKCTKEQLDMFGGLKPIDCIQAVEQGYVTTEQLIKRGVDLKSIERVRRKTLKRMGVEPRTEDEILAGKTDPLLKEALAAYARQNAAQAAPKPAAVITKANGAVSAPKPKAKPLTAQQVQVAEMMVRAKQIELLKARLAALKAEVRDTTNALTDEQKQAILDRNQAKDKPILK